MAAEKILCIRDRKETPFKNMSLCYQSPSYDHITKDHLGVRVHLVLSFSTPVVRLINMWFKDIDQGF